MRKPRCEALSGDVAPVLEECLYFLDVWYIQSIKNIHMLIVIVLELGSLGQGRKGQATFEHECHGYLDHSKGAFGCCLGYW